MKIEQNVEVDAPMDRVWALVNDVPRIAPCMPGAELTNVVDEKTYEGTVRVKLGPINMSYKGTAVLEEVDEASHTARVAANGKDVRGGGTARAGIVMKLDQVSERSTSLAVTADVHLTGKVASFGRGAIQDVSTKLFKQFAQCLRETLETEGAAIAGEAAATAAAAVPAAPAVPATPATAGGPAAAAVAAGAGGATTAPGAAGEAADARARAAADAEVAQVTAGQAASGAPLAGAESAETAPPRREVPAAGATTPRAPEPIKAGGLVLTAIIGLLRTLGEWLVGLVRRLFGRR
jgi:carbon monoxide dehydrogenase subunit G